MCLVCVSHWVTGGRGGERSLMLSVLKMANKAAITSWAVHKSTAPSLGWNQSHLALQQP